MVYLPVLIFVGLMTAGSGQASDERKCEWDGEREICTPAEPKPPTTGPKICDEYCQEGRRKREEARQRRQQESARARIERIDRISANARDELSAGRRAKAIALLWKAHKLDKEYWNIRWHLTALILEDALDRGQNALLTGDAKIIRDLERRYDDAALLFYRKGFAVLSSGDLALQAQELKSIIADLRDMQGQKRGKFKPPPIENLERLSLDPHPFELVVEWAQGTGPREYYFGPPSRMTRDLRDSSHGHRVRSLIYQKYGGRLRTGYAYRNYPAHWGLRGLFTTPNLTRQVVGSFRIDAEVIDGQIRYTATNTTSFKSYFYGIGLDWKSSVFRPMSNMRQTYVWWEPVQRPARK